VLATIKFNDDPAIETDEIDDVVPERDLSSKLKAGKAAASELAPDECLGFGLALAEVFGAVAILDMRNPPHPRPLSRGGERGDEE
jgi:hypothetical protein